MTKYLQHSIFTALVFAFGQLALGQGPLIEATTTFQSTLNGRPRAIVLKPASADESSFDFGDGDEPAYAVSGEFYFFYHLPPGSDTVLSQMTGKLNGYYSQNGTHRKVHLNALGKRHDAGRPTKMILTGEFRRTALLRPVMLERDTTGIIAVLTTEDDNGDSDGSAEETYEIP